MSGAEQEWSWPGVAADSDRGGEPGSLGAWERSFGRGGSGCVRAGMPESGQVGVVGLVRVGGSVWSPE